MISVIGKVVLGLMAVGMMLTSGCRDGATPNEQSIQAVNASDSQVTLQSGYYIRAEFVDQQSQTYSIASHWDAPPIFSEFTVKPTSDGYELEGGNLRESLLEFAIDQTGNLASTACFEDFCITSVEITSVRSFEITVKGHKQVFVSTKQLKQSEKSERMPK